MESNDLEQLLAQLRSAMGLINALYSDLTGEELDVEGAIRHYPLLGLGLAAGAGVAAGWWLGRKSAPAAPPSPPASPAQRALDLVEEALPEAVERMRARLPEIVLSDTAKARARVWLGNVMEQKLQQGIDRWAEGTDVRLGSFFRRATERLDPEDEVRLDDPESLSEEL